MQKKANGRMRASFMKRSCCVFQIIRGPKKDALDIAIDLTGHTKGGRTSLFAQRIAPVQINYRGYSGTMGAEFMDYIIADIHLIPPDHQDF